MRKQSAAPRLATSGAAGSSAGDDLSLSRTVIPAHIVSRLAGEGIHTLADWRALGRKRHAIFGVTGRMVREIDGVAARVNS